MQTKAKEHLENLKNLNMMAFEKVTVHDREQEFVSKMRIVSSWSKEEIYFLEIYAFQ